MDIDSIGISIGIESLDLESISISIGIEILTLDSISIVSVSKKMVSKVSGAHGLLRLFPVFAGDRSPLIQDNLCWQAKVLLPPVDEGFGA